MAALGPFPDGTLTTDEGSGNLPTENDQEAETLIARFEWLIQEEEQNPAIQSAEVEDPCESMTEPPVGRTQPQRGVAGSEVRVTASNVVGPEIGNWWRTISNRIGAGMVGADCTMTERVTIPRDTRPGRYDLFVIDSREDDAQDIFEVIE